jgi:GTPase SAR1 family protein
MFVGEEGVGKTSILSCFQSSSLKLKKNSRNISTNGIAMTEWKPNNTVKLQCWDFGGQLGKAN